MFRSPDDPIRQWVSFALRGSDCRRTGGYATSSYMRKWMSDRLKRRKKGGEAAKDQAKTNAPEPLQPKYFESDIDGKAGASAADTAPATAAEASTPEPPASQSSSSERSVSERLTSERPAQRSSAQRSSGPRSLPQRSPGQRSSGSGITPSSSQASSSQTSSSHTTSEQPGMEGSPADDESSGTGKETQADFLLGSRGAPELPLAAAVSGDSRNRNQNRPVRRRRRGGRGGAGWCLCWAIRSRGSRPRP